MVEVVAWTSGIDSENTIEIVKFPTTIEFRSYSDDGNDFVDVRLNREDVEDLTHELRLWLAKTVNN